ncbi:uncharacterized protein K452DRAFT_133013 [Aplosporella prunicola CBS 121167]|uniref:Uncharacterized protein n=1 Tax=Aplosporella prunicola CBS 121167 TaxID=1176127 RepID=A0A6A6BNY4_9PEZI|nr:uncharacterized protein K452DRAFT_133013 [Aplosporella prunicola CBS 121167]KAF2144975.1 hypothetical protein K452DRAFT_133013 [Aplosporella prunicola CBS 121167]
MACRVGACAWRRVWRAGRGIRAGIGAPCASVYVCKEGVGRGSCFGFWVLWWWCGVVCGCGFGGWMDGLVDREGGLLLAGAARLIRKSGSALAVGDSAECAVSNSSGCGLVAVCGKGIGAEFSWSIVLCWVKGLLRAGIGAVEDVEMGEMSFGFVVMWLLVGWGMYFGLWRLLFSTTALQLSESARVGLQPQSLLGALALTTSLLLLVRLLLWLLVFLL